MHRRFLGIEDESRRVEVPALGGSIWPLSFNDSGGGLGSLFLDFEGTQGTFLVFEC